MQCSNVDTFDEEILMDHVDIGWFITEDKDRWVCFSETLNEFLELFFLLDVLNFLNYVEIDLPSTSNVNDNWIDESLLSEILNFFRHRWRKQKSLSRTLFTFNKKARKRQVESEYMNEIMEGREWRKRKELIGK